MESEVKEKEIKYNPYCRYSIATVLLFYDIDKYIDISKLYHVVDGSNDDNIEIIDVDKDIMCLPDDRFIPCPTIQEAKHFLSKYLNIDICEYPKYKKNGKVFCADIWHNHRVIRHKKYSDKDFDTPEEAFTKAVAYVLTKVYEFPKRTKQYGNRVYLLHSTIENPKKLHLTNIYTYE